MRRVVFAMSPDIFSEIKEKQVELYDWLCEDHDMEFRGWLRKRFGIDPLSPTEFVAKVEYNRPPNYWNFL